MEATFLTNLTSPPLLFFFLGVFAALIRSDLEVPGQAAKFMSLYLLFAIGFKGGVALSESTLDSDVLLVLLAAVVLSFVIPIYTFWFLRKRFEIVEAAAIAACYGSVSAVTFVTAAGYLDAVNISWSGHLVAAMALMESPAIIAGILLYHRYRKSQEQTEPFAWSKLLHESCLNGSVLLIVGSMLIGWFSGSQGMEQLSPLISDLFLGMLCLFLLDMGIVAARRLMNLRSSSHSMARGQLSTMVVASCILPLVNAALGLALVSVLGLSEGDALLFVVLAASASYIAVPAAMRLVLPEANPGIYLSMSLAMTFPFNLLVGIPLYHAAIRWIL